MRRPYALLLLAPLAAASLAAETYYKWQDADGTWHYTTTPPPADRSGTQVQIQTRAAEAPVAAPAAAPAAAAPAAASPRDEGPKLSEAEAAQARRASCEQARRNVQTLQNNSVVRMDLDRDGTPEALDQAQVEAQLARARQQVREFCDPAG